MNTKFKKGDKVLIVASTPEVLKIYKKSWGEIGTSTYYKDVQHIGCTAIIVNANNKNCATYLNGKVHYPLEIEIIDKSGIRLSGHYYFEGSLKLLRVGELDSCLNL